MRTEFTRLGFGGPVMGLGEHSNEIFISTKCEKLIQKMLDSQKVIHCMQLARSIQCLDVLLQEEIKSQNFEAVFFYSR